MLYMHLFCTCSSLTFVRSIFLLLYSILSHIVCVYKQFSDQMAVLLVFKKSVISKVYTGQGKPQVPLPGQVNFTLGQVKMEIWWSIGQVYCNLSSLVSDNFQSKTRLSFKVTSLSMYNLESYFCFCIQCILPK